MYILLFDYINLILFPPHSHSISQLCKACLFENKNYVPNASNPSSPDRTNSQYYLVVVQYVESVNTAKLASELRGLRPPGSTRMNPKYFTDLRLAPEEVSEKLTGYGHNGVSPFGLLDKSIPIIVCKSILNVRPKFIWMGGGHKDLKLGVAVSEFVEAVDAIVLDVSEPRTLD
jgi:prolyl-tRNA editing enzyme YbaK/EbsC (Cys-tRNA(Pro) deacylase)